MAPSATAPGVQFCFDEGQCVGCAICADVCPEQALYMSRQDHFPVWIGLRCTSCGLCEQECPTAAITLPTSLI
jgi:Pyruvate/2-oxoacid:ferredoxin oxidoreductase delta subunit